MFIKPKALGLQIILGLEVILSVTASFCIYKCNISFLYKAQNSGVSEILLESGTRLHKADDTLEPSHLYMFYHTDRFIHNT